VCLMANLVRVRVLDLCSTEPHLAGAFVNLLHSEIT